MNTDMIWRIDSSSSENTEQLGRSIGTRLRGGEVIELSSDLGGGKTTFVRGLAVGMGSSDAVGSPSFTISRQYTAGDLTLHHYDFYRLSEPGLMAEELAEVVDDPKAVVVIEWAEIVAAVLPPHSVRIAIAATSEHDREFAITLPEMFGYLKGES